MHSTSPIRRTTTTPTLLSDRRPSARSPPPAATTAQAAVIRGSFNCRQGYSSNRPSTMARQLRVGIVGGGIGGLALAASLAKFGVESRVFERASAFGEAGAGIQMTPNAVRILRDLGLWQQLRSW